MSYFAAEVIELPKPVPHPNADRLSVFHLENPIRCTVVGRTEDWAGVSKAVYIMPDSVVGDHPVFNFLGSSKRIKSTKLRGIVSMGLLVPAQPDWEVGRDVKDELGVTKYEDSLENSCTQGNLQATKGPSGEVKYTDIQSLRKYPNLFSSNNNIVVEEKVHGESYRACYQNNTLYVGSRTRWLKEDNNTWWNSTFKAGLPEILPKYPNKIFMGENFGYIQDMRYGMNKGEYKVVFFDIYDIEKGSYLNFDDKTSLLRGAGLEPTPLLYRGRWPGYENVVKMSEGLSELHTGTAIQKAGKMIKPNPDNFKEGIVVKGLTENYNDKIGRMVLKYHSEAFLCRRG